MSAFHDCAWLSQVLKLTIRKARIADDALKRVRVQTVVSRYGNFPFPIGHAGMLAAGFRNPKTRFFEGGYSSLVRYIGE